MMKLGKNTRDNVVVGTHLEQKGLTLVVTNIIEVEKGKQVTTQILKHQYQQWIGHMIYARPLSWYYGMYINNQKESES